MEAGDSAIRQSGLTFAKHSDPYDQRSRDSRDRPPPYREGPATTMATATLLNPAPHHYQSTYSPSYSYSSSSTMPGIISPADSRRTSDESEPVRQSLPSISEVISGTKPAASSAYPPNIPTSMSGGHNLPSPFATSAPSRPFADISSQDRQHNSPRMPHGTAPYPPREHLPPFPDPSRGPLTTRPPPPPPVNTYNGIHPSTPMKLESHGVERQREEHHHMNGSYPQPPRESSQLPYPQPGHLPPGQVPLPAHPMSPRYVGPSLPSPFDGSRSSAHEDEFRRSGNKYEQTVNRYHEAWGYAESLAKIASSSRTIFNFADQYGRIASEEQGPHPMPGRLPTEREVGDMLNMTEWTRGLLENVRGMVQQSIMNDRVREANRSKAPYEDEDMTMYGDGMKGPYDMAGVKKRRGRAAPPGRCHSCNRIDTPEWRRGPDGARTLCNACGLHYAKLERKKQTDAKSIRPRPSDERN